MTQYAALVAIGKKVGLQPVFFEETLNDKLGFPLNEPFTNPIPIYPISKIQDEEVWEVEIDKTVGVDNNVFLLSPDKNYVVNDLLMTFDYWHDIENEIVEMFTFKDQITQFSIDYLNQIKV
jgi:hypothetical protein